MKVPQIMNKMTRKKEDKMEKTLVIAHRGACGYLPEHTFACKALAIGQGADFLELDLVMTKDDQLVVVHDHFLDGISNVAQVYPTRARQDGHFYVMDFTLAEIRQLQTTEPFTTENGKQEAVYPHRYPLWAGYFTIHTFAEELQFIRGLEKSLGRSIGLYVEIKAPWLHHQADKDISLAALKLLQQYGYCQRTEKIIVETFDYHELLRIKYELLPQLGMDLPLHFLIAQTDWHETQVKNQDGHWENYSYDWVFTENAMQEIARHFDGISPEYNMLIEVAASKKGNVIVSPLGQAAQQAGLGVHTYTVRRDKLPAYVDSMENLLDVLVQAGATGVFTDFPDLALKHLTGK